MALKTKEKMKQANAAEIAGLWTPDGPGTELPSMHESTATWESQELKLQRIPSTCKQWKAPGVCVRIFTNAPSACSTHAIPRIEHFQTLAFCADWTYVATPWSMSNVFVFNTFFWHSIDSMTEPSSSQLIESTKLRWATYKYVQNKWFFVHGSS